MHRALARLLFVGLVCTTVFSPSTIAGCGQQRGPNAEHWSIPINHSASFTETTERLLVPARRWHSASTNAGTAEIANPSAATVLLWQQRLSTEQRHQAPETVLQHAIAHLAEHPEAFELELRDTFQANEVTWTRLQWRLRVGPHQFRQVATGRISTDGELLLIVLSCPLAQAADWAPQWQTWLASLQLASAP